MLNARLEQIHARLGDPSRDIVAANDENTLHAELDPVGLVRDDAGEDAPRRTSRWPLMLIFLLMLAGLLWYYARIERWQDQVGQLRSNLAEHPGYLLTKHDTQAWRSFSV